MTKYKVFLCLVFLLVAVSVYSGRAAGADDTEAYTRTVESYMVPDVTLVNQDGKRVKFRSLLNSKKVVILDFIYTTCTTICPVLSAEFADLEGLLYRPAFKRRKALTCQDERPGDTLRCHETMFSRHLSFSLVYFL